jgi:hypothetical protein
LYIGSARGECEIEVPSPTIPNFSIESTPIEPLIFPKCVKGLGQGIEGLTDLVGGTAGILGGRAEFIGEELFLLEFSNIESRSYSKRPISTRQADSNSSSDVKTCRSP